MTKAFFCALGAVLTLALGACGGGGGGSTEPEKPSEPEVVEVMLIPQWAATGDDELAFLPRGAFSFVGFHGVVPNPPAPSSIVHGVIDGTCATPVLCTTGGHLRFGNIQTVSLQTDAPIVLQSGRPIRLLVDADAPVGGVATLIITEATGRQVSRTYEVR